MILLIF